MVAVLLTAVWLVGAPIDAFAAKQVSQLVSDPGLTCTGTKVGKSIVNTRADGTVKVKVKFRTGPANDSGTVFWTCTNVANGCHDQACGFIDLGTITTDGFGVGVFKTILPGNPFPGSFVHLDVLMNAGGTFDSIFPSVPLGASGGASGAQGGDPTR
jgi:hypothetical protein